MKILKQVLILAVLFIPAAAIFCRGTGEEPEMQFNFAFIQKNVNGEITVIDSNNDVTTLSEGDQIRVFLQPVKNSYIYLYLYNADKNLLLVFPSKKYLKDDYDFEKCFYIHEGTEWFSEWMDLGGDEGVDKFEFIVSKDRLKHLEAITKEYLILYYEGADSETELKRAKEAVLGELVALRKEKNEFISESDVQVPLGGGVRGEEITATRISTSTDYGKTVIFQY